MPSLILIHQSNPALLKASCPRVHALWRQPLSTLLRNTVRAKRRKRKRSKQDNGSDISNVENSIANNNTAKPTCDDSKLDHNSVVPDPSPIALALQLDGAVDTPPAPLISAINQPSGSESGSDSGSDSDCDSSNDSSEASSRSASESHESFLYDQEKNDAQFDDVNIVKLFKNYIRDKTPVRFATICRKCSNKIHPQSLSKGCFECGYFLCNSCYSAQGVGAAQETSSMGIREGDDTKKLL